MDAIVTNSITFNTVGVLLPAHTPRVEFDAVAVVKCLDANKLPKSVAFHSDAIVIKSIVSYI